MTRRGFIPVPFLLIVALFVAVCGACGGARAMDIQVVEVPDVGEVWLVENHALPVIAVDFAFRGAGAAQDPEDRDGLAALAATLLTEGAGDLDATHFRGRLEELSIELSFDAGRDHLSGRLLTLRDNRVEAFRLLGLAVSEPRFDGDALSRVRNLRLAQIAQGEQRPGTVASRAWYARAFPDHPYGRRIEGTAETVRAITADDLRDFAATRLARGNLVATVVGAISAEEVVDLLGRAVTPLQPSPYLADVAEPQTGPSPGVMVIRRPIPQSTVIFGHKGIRRDDPDWFPALVMNYILGGGGFASRLVEEVREKRGLAYSVNTSLSPLAHAGMIIGSVGTQNERVRESMDIISAEFRKMREDGATARELDGAKKYLTGSYPLSFDTSPRIAGQLTAIQLEGLDPGYVAARNGYIEAVTLEDVARVAERLLDPDALLWVVVGQPQNIDAPAP